MRVKMFLLHYEKRWMQCWNDLIMKKKINQKSNVLYREWWRIITHKHIRSEKMRTHSSGGMARTCEFGVTFDVFGEQNVISCSSMSKSRLKFLYKKGTWPCSQQNAKWTYENDCRSQKGIRWNRIKVTKIKINWSSSLSLSLFPLYLSLSFSPWTHQIWLAVISWKLLDYAHPKSYSRFVLTERWEG